MGRKKQHRRTVSMRAGLYETLMAYARATGQSASAIVEGLITEKVPPEFTVSEGDARALADARAVTRRHRRRSASGVHTFR